VRCNAPAAHRRRFERPRRVGLADPEAGLDLSLVRAAAQAHGGSVRAVDAAGGGARFVIELPAAR
jgi:signal transduction histidine kinase